MTEKPGLNIDSRMKKQQNILVTGGAGFIGSHVVDALIRDGHQVSVLDDLSTGRAKNLPENIELLVGDIRERDAVDDCFSTETFDAVIHHAAQVNVRSAVADPLFDASVNIVGLLNVLECCVKHNVERVIFASSGGAIYGEQDSFPADEDHPTKPISPYGVSKLSSEAYLFYYNNVYGMSTVSLRYANVYGPRQDPRGEAGVVAIFTGRLLEGAAPVINGNGRQTRDFVFVEDVARANVLALACEGHQIFNVGTGVETDVKRLFDMIREEVGIEVESRHGPGMKGEQLRSAIGIGRIEESLGWKPEVSLREGLAKTVEYFKQEGK